MVYSISRKDKTLKGTIHLPSSKSESNRALIIRALCEKPFEIINLSAAEDTKILQKILQPATSSEQPAALFNVGAAGTAMRFLTAYFAIQDGKEIVLTGSERMKQRPLKILAEALKNLGADIEYTEKNGFPPLKIKGKKLTGGKIKVDGSISSQYISALLMIAPKLKNGLTIEFTGELTSKPYIEMTLKIMEHFGVKCTTELYSVKNYVSIQSQNYQPKIFIVESDWSAASYWYEMAAFADEVDLTLTGLKKESLQGDSVVAKMFEQFGIITNYTGEGINLKKDTGCKIQACLPKGSSACRQDTGCKTDFSNCPDLAQTLAVTCAGLGIQSHLTGLKTLRIKETDRIKALQDELKKLGVKTEIINDELIINKSAIGNRQSAIGTYNDHRMAMSFAPLAMKTGEIKIENTEVVKKSYPAFWEDLKRVGFEICEV